MSRFEVATFDSQVEVEEIEETKDEQEMTSERHDVRPTAQESYKTDK